MPSTDKPLAWLHGEVKSPPFSPAARIEAGMLLSRLQAGESLGLPHSRPMPVVGAGCHELRVVDGNVSWRLVYYIDRDAVVMLDVFQKKTEATPKSVISNCQRRLAAYLKIVRERSR